MLAVVILNDLRGFVKMGSFSKFQGPNWDNSQEYSNFNDSKIAEDLTSIEENIAAIIRLSNVLSESVLAANNETIKATDEQIINAQKISETKLKLKMNLGNLGTFANCALSVNGSDQSGKALLSKVQTLGAKSNAASKAYFSWLILIEESSLESFLKHPIAKTEFFQISRSRLRKDQLLSLSEETLIEELGVNGPTAFGNLYDDISSSITCKIPEYDPDKIFGLSQASALLEDSNPTIRKSAYREINSAWNKNTAVCASILNSLSGWRLDLYKKRSMSFLEAPLNTNCISEDTLKTMFDTIKSRKSVATRALKTQAKILNTPQLGPWDLFAPFPSSSNQEGDKWTFNEAIELIKKAFGSIDSSMSDFVQTMVDKQWLEGSLGAQKRPGAYCTKFPKSRSPRVYMSYSGGIKDVITLAHELGHAYHNWIMRDLPINETTYPMTLAETASIFAQTVVNDHLLAACKTDTDRLKVLWTDSREAEAFLLNIPVRYQFEEKFYERRRSEVLSVEDFKQTMTDYLEDWYGDSLSEGNEMFWASKLHFHISGLSFYNFPYSFGYLFSLGVYSRKSELGPQFFDSYVNLLRDTGRMTAEELASKHLGVDLTKPEFWNKSIDIVSAKMKRFEQLSESYKQ